MLLPHSCAKAMPRLLTCQKNLKDHSPTTDTSPSKLHVTLSDEMTRVTVISADVMRMLHQCNDLATFHSMTTVFQRRFDDWYKALRPEARVNNLNQLPWQDVTIGLAYVHLGHLGGLQLPLRKLLSIHDPQLKLSAPDFGPKELVQMARVIDDALLAAR